MSGIRAPVQMHHGAADETVPVTFDERLDQSLGEHGVEHQLYLYPGEGHLQVRQSAAVLARIHDWYAAHGMF